MATVLHSNGTAGSGRVCGARSESYVVYSTFAFTRSQRTQQIGRGDVAHVVAATHASSLGAVGYFFCENSLPTAASADLPFWRLFSMSHIARKFAMSDECTTDSKAIYHVVVNMR